jgi:hypothetical protein
VLFVCRPTTHVKAEGRLDERGDTGSYSQGARCVCYTYSAFDSDSDVVDESQDPNAKMAYTWYEEDVVQKHGVLLEGWTGVPFGNPSELSTSLTALGKLLGALKTGACRFRKLSPAEAAQRKEKWDADVAAGRATAKSRAQRSDAGVPRKRARDDADKENDNADGARDDDSNGGVGDGLHDAPPPAKRTRKNAKTTTAPSKRRAAPARPRPKTRAAAAATPRDDAATKAALERLKSSRKRVQSRARIDDSDAEDGPSAENAQSGAHADPASAAQPAQPIV